MFNIKNTKIYKYLSRSLIVCMSYLTIMTIFASFFRVANDIDSLKYLLFSLSTILLFCTYIPWLITKTKFKQFNYQDSIVSSLILYLVLNPQQDILNIILVCVFYLIFRIFVRYRGMPIFNPAVIALVSAVLIGYIFNIHFSISWWGTSFSPRFTDYGISIAVFLTLPFGIFFLYKFKKFYIFVVSFLLSSMFFIIYNLSLGNPDIPVLSSYISTFWEGTFFFAILLMLIEPKTSPVKVVPQFIFGIIFYFTWIILTSIHFNAALIMAIFTANIYYFGYKVFLDVKVKLIKKNTPVKTTLMPNNSQQISSITET